MRCFDLVSDSLDVSLPVITKMVNASLSIAHFPSEWNEAIVKPLLCQGLCLQELAISQ